MSYSVIPILHNRADKNSLHKIQIQVIYKRIKHYAATDLKVMQSQFENGSVIKHPHADKFNGIINKLVTDIETRILQALRVDGITKDNFKEIVQGKKPVVHAERFFDLAMHLAKTLSGKFTEGAMKHYKVVANKVQDYRADARLSDIDKNFMEGFEHYLRSIGNDVNTVGKNLQIMKSILRKAGSRYDMGKLQGYKIPRYQQKLPVWLTEKEIETLHRFIDNVHKPGHKTAGMYFLLSCYTGYRISDAKRFDPGEMIHGNKIVLRADKNKRIVSIPVHKRLKPVIAWCKNNPFNLSQDKARKYVKELCSLAGIKKDVKWHSSRHSFAMLLMAKGFTIDEVSMLIGDTPLVTAVYARVHNATLDKKIRAKLG